jgi:hypothetical protein
MTWPVSADPSGVKTPQFSAIFGTTEVVPFHETTYKTSSHHVRNMRSALDFAAALAVVCFYTGKEVDPAYEQRFFEL